MEIDFITYTDILNFSSDIFSLVPISDFSSNDIFGNDIPIYWYLKRLVLSICRSRTYIYYKTVVK